MGSESRTNGFGAYEEGASGTWNFYIMPLDVHLHIPRNWPEPSKGSR